MQAIRKSPVAATRRAAHVAPHPVAHDWSFDGDDTDDDSTRRQATEDRLALAIRVIEALGLRPVAGTTGSFPRH